MTLCAPISYMSTHFLIGYLFWKHYASYAESQSQRGKGKMAICQVKKENRIPYLLYTEVINHLTAIKSTLKCPSVLLAGS